MTPTATRLEHRLSDRQAWFHNEWLFKWHHIGGDVLVQIDLFDGRQASYSGIRFWGSPRDIYWDAISRGLRKEVVDQFSWIEEAAKGYERSVAIQAIKECAGLLASFTDVLRKAAIAKDRVLRGDGVTFPAEEDRGHWAGTTKAGIQEQADALIAALFPPAAVMASVAAPPHTTKGSEIAAAGEADDKPFQVALSFAGEQREYAQEVAKALVARHISVFYDQFQAVDLWGADGAEYFHRIYSRDARFVVMFISADYAAKAWTRHERRSAISRQMNDSGEYILPVRFDQTEIDGIPDTIQYLEAKNYTPAELAVQIARKLGVSSTEGKASHVPPPSSSATSGEVTFDYSAHDGSCNRSR